MRFLLCVAVVIGCRHEVRSPTQGASRVAARIAILEAHRGLLVVDPSEGTTRSAARTERLDWFALEQRGPFVTCRLSDMYAIDLRDADGGSVPSNELRAAILDSSAISTGGDVVIASILDTSALRVVSVSPRAVPADPRTFAAPAPEIVSLAIARDGRTLAIVAGPRPDSAPGGASGPSQDLFTIRVRDGATRRWTTTGDVVDAAFIDDDHVVMSRSASAYDVLTLDTGELHSIAAPAGWETDLLGLYVGWSRAEFFTRGGRGTAPLLPLRTDDRRALFEPRSGRTIQLARDEQIIATAPGGSSVVVTTPCHGPSALIRRWLDGRVSELRAQPDPAACAASDAPTADVPVSAAFSADGRFLVFAMPAGAGWRVQVVDDAGHTRTLRESPDPLVVLGWP